MTASWTERVHDRYSSQGLAGRLTPRGGVAVVVVDLINGFTDPACPPGSDLDDVVATTRTLLDMARAQQVPVFFTTIAFDAADLEQLVWLEKMPVLRPLVAGSHWVDVDARLERRVSEPVVVKKAASAFAGTELADLLREAHVGTVIVCGATTSGCIRATVVDACALDYAAFVPRDCVGDRAVEPHEANLLDIDAKYGDVVNSYVATELLAAEVKR